MWEARDVTLHRPVALKLLRPLPGGPPPDERLLQEAETAARLAHPNIVTLYDAGRSERGAYLVLELLRGETLASRLGARPLPARESLRIVSEIAKGLAHAHERGVAHRDLKPANVFLCEDGQVKLLDLGLAHAFGRPRVAGGTPQYMAPEQSRGAPEDERTDVFALGVILYYGMLAGELPFADEASLCGARPAPALALERAPALSELVRQMLAKDPVDRPRNAGEVVPRLATCMLELDRAPANARVTVVRGRRAWAMAAGVAALAALGLGTHVGGSPRGGAPPENASEPSSLVVLPFEDLSPGHDQVHFSVGMSDEIRNALARVAGLRVIGRTSSMALKERHEDARAIGRELGVKAVLDGSVRRSGTRVRVAVELIETGAGTQLWSDVYEREVANVSQVFQVQSAIALQVLAIVDARVRDRRVARLGRIGAANEGRVEPASVAAYEAYLLARLRTAESSPDRPAEELFQRAVDLDPGFAPAWAELAGALVQWTQYASESPAARSLRIERGLEAAERAIAVAPGLPDGFEARALVRFSFLWDWRGALADADRAVALGPGRPVAHRRRALVLRILGDADGCREELQTALELDPLDATTWSLLAAHALDAGRLDRAREALERALDIDRRGGPALLMLAGQLALREGRPADALALFERNAVETNRLLGRVEAHHDLRNERASREALAELTSRHGANSPFVVAAAHAWRGERDLAFEWLERGIAQRAGGLNVLDLGAALRGDPRWPELLRRLDLPVPGSP